MKGIVLIILSLCSLVQSYGQPIQVGVRIFDVDNNLIRDGKGEVIIDELGVIQPVNNDGTALVDIEKFGKYRIIATHPDYEPIPIEENIYREMENRFINIQFKAFSDEKTVPIIINDPNSDSGIGDAELIYFQKRRGRNAAPKTDEKGYTSIVTGEKTFAVQVTAENYRTLLDTINLENNGSNYKILSGLVVITMKKIDERDTQIRVTVVEQRKNRFVSAARVTLSKDGGQVNTLVTGESGECVFYTDYNMPEVIQVKIEKEKYRINCMEYKVDAPVNVVPVIAIERARSAGKVLRAFGITLTAAGALTTATSFIPLKSSKDPGNENWDADRERAESLRKYGLIVGVVGAVSWYISYPVKKKEKRKKIERQKLCLIPFYKFENDLNQLGFAMRF